MTNTDHINFSERLCQWGSLDRKRPLHIHEARQGSVHLRSLQRSTTDTVMNPADLFDTEITDATLRRMKYNDMTDVSVLNWI